MPIQINKEEEKMLRSLAGKVANYSALPIQAERMELWKASNNLKPKRAMVLANLFLGFLGLQLWD